MRDGANYNEGAFNVGFFHYNYFYPNVCLLWMTKSGADHLVLSLFTANNTALTPQLMRRPFRDTAIQIKHSWNCHKHPISLFYSEHSFV
jgi:hypothetical protein